MIQLDQFKQSVWVSMLHEGEWKWMKLKKETYDALMTEDKENQNADVSFSVPITYTGSTMSNNKISYPCSVSTGEPTIYNINL